MAARIRRNGSPTGMVRSYLQILKVLLIAVGAIALISIGGNEATADPGSSSSPATAKPKTIDVLALIDPAKDSVQGDWVKSGGSLTCNSAGDHDRIRLPVQLHGSYQLALTLTRERRAGNRSVYLQLPVGKALVTLWVDHWGRASGLSKIDGKRHEDGNGTNVDGLQLTDKTQNDLNVHVSLEGDNAEITIDLNDKSLIKWHGSQSELSTADVCDPNDGLCIGVEKNSISISHFSITANPGDLNVLRSSPPIGQTKTEVQPQGSSDKAQSTQQPGAQQRFVVIFDDDASMAGEKVAFRRMLDRVFFDKPDANTSLNIITFSDGHVSKMAAEPLATVGKNITFIQAFMRTLAPTGSADGFVEAVSEAVKQKPDSVVIVVGEAKIADDDHVDAIAKSLSGPDGFLAVIDTSKDGNQVLKLLAIKAGGKYFGKDVLDFSQFSEASITPEEITQRRNTKLKDTKDEIAQLQSLVSKLPPDQRESSSVEKKLEFTQASEKRILNQSDASIADEISEQKAQAAMQAEAERAATEQKAMADKEAKDQRELLHQQQLAERQQQAAEMQQQIAAARTRTFPDWNVPWKTCPYCGGTGRDAAAERDLNTRNAGIIASQSIGTGTVTQIPGAVVTCPVCGGCGQVPDKSN